jgi:hypothetical protein
MRWWANAGLRASIMAVAIGGWTLPSSAADSPAQLVVGEHSVEALLRVPRKLEAGRYEIHCESHILASGYAATVFCYTMAEPAPSNLIRAVIDAAKRARYVPAMRAGQPANVYMLTTVFVDTTFEEAMVLAVPNNGVERKKYGLLYSSPQRVILKRQSYPLWLYTREIPGGRPDLLVWSQFQVDERGDVRGFRLDKVISGGPRMMKHLERYASKEIFLPGYHEGRSVPALYAEPIFSP